MRNCRGYVVLHCVFVLTYIQVDEATPIHLPSSSQAQTNSGFTSPPSGPLSPSSPLSRAEGSVSSMSSAFSRSDKIPIPDYWRQETQDCLDEGVLDDESRGDITRTLVTLLVAKYGPKPGRSRCEELARLLILKYPFAKDDLGNGYVRYNIIYYVLAMHILSVYV